MLRSVLIARGTGRQYSGPSYEVLWSLCPYPAHGLEHRLGAYHPSSPGRAMVRRCDAMNQPLGTTRFDDGMFFCRECQRHHPVEDRFDLAPLCLAEYRLWQRYALDEIQALSSGR